MRNILYLFLCTLFFTTQTQAAVSPTNPDLRLSTENWTPGEEDIITKRQKKVPGYIIKKNGKEEKGSVIPGSVTDNEVKVVFISKSGKKQTFKPKDLKGYGFESSETDDDLGIEENQWLHFETHKVDYPPKPFGPRTVFMEREEKGKVSLYCYYVEVRDNPKQPFRYFYYMKDENGKLSKVEEKTFTKMSKKLFKDYTAMTDRVGRKDFKYRNLDRMVRDYNYWVDNQHDRSEYRVAMINKK